VFRDNQVGFATARVIRFEGTRECAALLVAEAIERVDHEFVALPEVVVTDAGEVAGFELFVDVDPLAEDELTHVTPPHVNGFEHPVTVA
jgi:hypothetical protein